MAAICCGSFCVFYFLRFANNSKSNPEADGVAPNMA
jgi:hypothetical protein